MSTGPERGWPSPSETPGSGRVPAGQRPGPYWTVPAPWPGTAASGSVAAHPARSIWWRIVRSLWILVPILGFGCLGGAAFLFVGLRARRPVWWISGIGYLAFSVVWIVVLDASADKSTAESWATGAFLAAWFASILHACLINSAWLRYLATRTPWYDQLVPTGTLAPAPTYPPPTLMYRPPTAAPDQAWATHAGSAGPVDVNAATAEELADLPGFGADRAHAVAAERATRRGFGSVAEFVAVAGLAPHEYAHLKDRLHCAPNTTTHIPHHGQPPQGRVLDV